MAVLEHLAQRRGEVRPQRDGVRPNQGAAWLYGPALTTPKPYDEGFARRMRFQMSGSQTTTNDSLSHGARRNPRV